MNAPSASSSLMPSSAAPPHTVIPSGPAPEPGSGERPTFRLALLLASLTAIGPLAIDMYLPAFPHIARELEVDVGAVQLTLSVYFAGVALAQALYGPLADRFGRRLPLIVGLSIFLLGSVGCAVAPSVGFLTVARLISALGGASGMVIARAVVRDRCTTEEMAKMFSLLMLIMGIAPILGPSLGGLLLEATGWQGIFWFLAIYAGGCIFIVTFGLRESLPVQMRIAGGIGSALRTYRTLARNPWFIVHTTIAAATSAVLFGYVSGAPVIFSERHGLSARAFSILFGCNAISLIAAASLNRWILPFSSPRAILVAASIALAATSWSLLLAILLGIDSLPVTEVGIILMLGCIGLIFPNVGALSLTPFAAMAGSAGALQGTMQFSVGALAGAFIGVMHDGTSLPTGLIFAGASLVACLVAWRTRRWSGS